MPYSLAIDIGASSGRHLIGEVRDGKIIMEEVYRFENGMKNQDGTLIWDIDELFSSIVKGLKRCAEIGKIPSTVAIDTWGVDYVLLDGEGKEKHTPQIHVNGDEVRITVGPEGGMHPMQNEHGIAWICLVTSGGNQRKMLVPDGRAEAVFKLAEGEKVVRAFAYCNLHGLWVAECK